MQKKVAFPQARVLRVSWQVVLDYILENNDHAREIDRVVAQLRQISGDKGLSEVGRQCEKGSTILTLKGTDEGLRVVESLFNSGELLEICGLQVEQVSLTSTSYQPGSDTFAPIPDPTKPAMTTPKADLTPKERLALSRQITGLTVQDFNDLLLLLSPPQGIVPPPSAPPGDRTFALLTWAQSTTGCGLVAVQNALNDIIP